MTMVVVVRQLQTPARGGTRPRVAECGRQVPILDMAVRQTWTDCVAAAR